MSEDVSFAYSYDAAGLKTSVATKIGTTDDYINEYDYDALGRIVKVTQSGVSGGNSVAEKRVDFGYDDDGTSSTLTRYADLAGENMVAATDQAFDELGRVSDIVHKRADSIFADYDYTWDAASRITEIDMVFENTSYNDTATYDYDDTSQLTAADYTSQMDESYQYDDTGNRTNTGYTTGDHNRLTSDGTYNYTYDAEGNRTGKYSDSQRTVAVQKYFWDHRNRLTKVELYDAQASLETTVYYAYDHNNRLYKRTVDAATDSRQIFIRDDDQIVMELEDDNTGDVTNSDRSRRVLWLPGSVDQSLAEEHIGTETYWTLVDHLGTVRDVVSYNAGTDTTTLAQHNQFNAFGVLVSTPTIETLALWTGRLQDYLTGLQYNRERWYNAQIGRWLSEDPISFEAGDVNLYRYVKNGVPSRIDPTGKIDEAVCCLLGIDPAGGGHMKTGLERPIPGGIWKNKWVLNVEKLCQRVVGNTACQEKGVTEQQCKKDVTSLLKHGQNTPSPVGVNGCIKWVGAFTETMPHELYASPVWRISVKWYEYPIYSVLTGTRTGHQIVIITMCNDDVFYMDNGWLDVFHGGPDHKWDGVFPPERMPWFLKPAS